MHSVYKHMRLILHEDRAIHVGTMSQVRKLAVTWCKVYVMLINHPFMYITSDVSMEHEMGRIWSRSAPCSYKYSSYITTCFTPVERDMIL